MEQDLYSRRFCFIHESGDELYPVKLRNLDTGRLAFRVSATRNIKGAQLEVEEDEMVHRVLKDRYKVRMKSPTTGRNGGYSPDGRSIREVRELR